MFGFNRYYLNIKGSVNGTSLVHINALLCFS